MDYKFKPDVLSLLIDIEQYSALDIVEYETENGVEEIDYLYSDNILLGAVIETEKYYADFGISTEGLVSVSLAPALRNRSNVDLPTIYEFCQSLNEIVNSEGNWILICEQDCEQRDLPRLTRGSKQSKAALHNLYKFIEGSISCPTFLIGDCI